MTMSSGFLHCCGFQSLLCAGARCMAMAATALSPPALHCSRCACLCLCDAPTLHVHVWGSTSQVSEPQYVLAQAFSSDMMHSPPCSTAVVSWTWPATRRRHYGGFARWGASGPAGCTRTPPCATAAHLSRRWTAASSLLRAQAILWKMRRRTALMLSPISVR